MKHSRAHKAWLHMVHMCHQAVQDLLQYEGWCKPSTYPSKTQPLAGGETPPAATGVARAEFIRTDSARLLSSMVSLCCKFKGEPSPAPEAGVASLLARFAMGHCRGPICSVSAPNDVLLLAPQQAATAAANCGSVPAGDACSRCALEVLGMGLRCTCSSATSCRPELKGSRGHDQCHQGAADGLEVCLEPLSGNTPAELDLAIVIKQGSI